jgi:hypothetical protein
MPRCLALTLCMAYFLCAACVNETAYYTPICYYEAAGALFREAR